MIPTLNGLVEVLRGKYPDRLPRRQLSDYEQGRLTGQQEIIDHIKRLIDEQFNEVT